MIKYFCDRCGTEVTYGWYIQHSSDPYLWCETCVSGVSLNTSLIETEYSEEKAKLETWHTGQITDLYASNEYEFEEYEN